MSTCQSRGIAPMMDRLKGAGALGLECTPPAHHSAPPPPVHHSTHPPAFRTRASTPYDIEQKSLVVGPRSVDKA
eukprot:scaffold41748_cov31-Tisochrysis_lutea.AAC.2